MRYRVTCQNLGIGGNEIAHRGDEVEESSLTSKENIEDLVAMGAIVAIDPKPKTLSQMNRDELVVAAAGLGARFEPDATKAEILKAIKEHMEAKSQSAAASDENPTADPHAGSDAQE